MRLKTPEDNVVQVQLRERKYHNGGTAVELVNEHGESWTVVSVWLPVTPLLPKGAFYVKHWGENEWIVPQLIEIGALEPVNAALATAGCISGVRAYQLGDYVGKRLGAVLAILGLEGSRESSWVDVVLRDGWSVALGYNNKSDDDGLLGYDLCDPDYEPKGGRTLDGIYLETPVEQQAAALKEALKEYLP